MSNVKRRKTLKFQWSIDCCLGEVLHFIFQKITILGMVVGSVSLKFQYCSMFKLGTNEL